MRDIENSRKTAEKGAEWVMVKQPKNSRKNSRNTRKTVKARAVEIGKTEPIALKQLGPFYFCHLMYSRT